MPQVQGVGMGNIGERSLCIVCGRLKHHSELDAEIRDRKGQRCVCDRCVAEYPETSRYAASKRPLKRVA
jgi:hypothetical protein